MTCCAAVRGSFVGMRRFLPAVHHEEIGLSCWDDVGEISRAHGLREKTSVRFRDEPKIYGTGPDELNQQRAP